LCSIFNPFLRVVQISRKILKNMQIKFFTIPILGGEAQAEELNKFMRSSRVLQSESHLVKEGEQNLWCFCIRYIENSEPVRSASSKRSSEPVDYKSTLDEASFSRYDKLQAIRTALFKSEGVPAYLIFTNDELASLAKIEHLTLETMQQVKGVGKARAEKYGKYFITVLEESSDLSKIM
jgi:superfamily II DNA helicase RecQ